MKILHLFLLIPLFVLNISTMAFANDRVDENKQSSFVDLKVGIELTRLEESAQSMAVSMDEASKALQALASQPDFTEQQKEQISKTFKKVELLAHSFQQSVDKLPEAVSQSTPPIMNAINSLFSHIQVTIIIALISLILLLVAALIAVYYWVIKPFSKLLTQTTRRIDDMAIALKVTAEIVDKSSDSQLAILQILKSNEISKHDK
jgi:hypothetical protein